MTGFQAPTCATCGHAEGDHKSNRSATNPRHGACLVAGCDCRKFDDQLRRDIEVLSRAALTPHNGEGEAA